MHKFTRRDSDSQRGWESPMPDLPGFSRSANQDSEGSAEICNIVCINERDRRSGEQVRAALSSARKHKSRLWACFCVFCRNARGSNPRVGDTVIHITQKRDTKYHIFSKKYARVILILIFCILCITFLQKSIISIICGRSSAAFTDAQWTIAEGCRRD